MTHCSLQWFRLPWLLLRRFSIAHIFLDAAKSKTELLSHLLLSIQTYESVSWGKTQAKMGRATLRDSCLSIAMTDLLIQTILSQHTGKSLDLEKGDVDASFPQFPQMKFCKQSFCTFSGVNARRSKKNAINFQTSWHFCYIMKAKSMFFGRNLWRWIIEWEQLNVNTIVGSI